MDFKRRLDSAKGIVQLTIAKLSVARELIHQKSIVRQKVGAARAT